MASNARVKQRADQRKHRKQERDLMASAWAESSVGSRCTQSQHRGFGARDRNVADGVDEGVGAALEEHHVLQRVLVQKPRHVDLDPHRTQSQAPDTNLQTRAQPTATRDRQLTAIKADRDKESARGSRLVQGRTVSAARGQRECAIKTARRRALGKGLG